MPIQFSEHTTESGMRYLRSDVSGHVDLDDAKAFEAYIKRPEWHRGLALSVVQKGTEYAPDARKLFNSMTEDITALATVVTSPIVRAAINLMMSIGKIRGKSPLRMFTSEAEALAWLESKRGDLPEHMK
jgi:hypothetical protein